MKQSESIKDLMQAIHNLQQEADYIKKNAQGQVGSQKTKYANLSGTWDLAKPLLEKHNLTVYQTPSTGENGTGDFFVSTIYHNPSEQYISSRVYMHLQRDDPQALGAAITYYRRYMLTSQLGLITDDDNDAKTHRLATSQQKQQIVGALKLVFPDINSADQINKTLENIIGKHPSRIREDEASGYVDLIKAYKDHVSES